MPYDVKKQKCKKSDGGSGSYVLSYTDKKGKKHRNCHTSRKGAKGQIAAIEAEGTENNVAHSLRMLESFIRETLTEEAWMPYKFYPSTGEQISDEEAEMLGSESYLDEDDDAYTNE